MPEEKTKIKRKKWIQIIAPKIFNEAVLGEITITDPNLAIGRTIKVNLMSLIGDARRQNTEIGFKIVKIQDNKAQTEMISYKITLSSMKRLVRRGKGKIEDSFTCLTADNKSVRIKPFLITRFAVKRSVLTAIKKLTIEILTREVKKSNYDSLINALVSNKLQKDLVKELNKIYPLRTYEIREMKIERVKKQEKPKETPEKKPEEKPKEEKKEALKEEKKEAVEEPKKEGEGIAKEEAKK